MTILTDQKIITQIGDHKYRITKWNVATTTVEGFKLIKLIAPALAMFADMKGSKSDLQKELDDVFFEQSESDYVWTGVVSQLLPHLEEEHFLDLQHKLFQGLEVKDEEKDEWITIDFWGDHFSKEEFQPDWMEAFVFSFSENLVNFILKQRMLTSKIEMVSKSLKETMNKFLKEPVEKDTKELS